MDFAHYIAHPENLDRTTLYKLRVTVGRYPCFDAARLLLLKNLYILHDIEFGKEMRRAALYLKDRRMLFELMREYGNLYCDLSANSGRNAMMRDPDFASNFLTEFADRIYYGADVCSTRKTFSLPLR